MDARDIAHGVETALWSYDTRTRRERIATEIFAAMHGNSVCQPYAPEAVKEADKLIAALDSTDDGAR